MRTEMHKFVRMRIYMIINNKWNRTFILKFIWKHKKNMRYIYEIVWIVRMYLEDFKINSGASNT